MSNKKLLTNMVCVVFSLATGTHLTTFVKLLT